MHGYLFPYTPRQYDNETAEAYRARRAKAPLATGILNIEGITLKLAAWSSTTKTGRKGYSITAEYPKDSPKRLVVSEAQPDVFTPENDPLPFD